MSEPMWVTCADCGRVVLRAHVDSNGLCSVHVPEMNNTHAPTPTLTEEDWRDMGRPEAEEASGAMLIPEPTTSKRK